MKMEHNGIKFIHDIEKSIIEVDTAENGVTTDVQFVLMYSNLLSYLKYKKIRFFVMNKKNNGFELSEGFYMYREKIIIGDLVGFGVERIFYLVTVDKKKKYRKELPDYVNVVGSYGEIDELIWKQKKHAT